MSDSWDRAILAAKYIGDNQWVTVHRNGEVIRWNGYTSQADASIYLPEDQLLGAEFSSIGQLVTWGWGERLYAIDAHTLDPLWVQDVLEAAGYEVAEEGDEDEADGEEEEGVEDEEDFEEEDDAEEDADDEDDDAPPVIVRAFFTSDNGLLVSTSSSWLERFNAHDGSFADTLDPADAGERSFIAWTGSDGTPDLPAWIECHDWRNLAIVYPGAAKLPQHLTIPSGNLVALSVIDGRRLALRRRGGPVQLWDYVARTLLHEWKLKAQSLHVASHEQYGTRILVSLGDEGLTSLDPTTLTSVMAFPGLPKFDRFLTLRDGRVCAWHGLDVYCLDIARGTIAGQWRDPVGYDPVGVELEKGILLTYSSDGGHGFTVLPQA